MEHSETMKFLRGSKPPLTKANFLFMVKSLSKSNAIANETKEEKEEKTKKSKGIKNFSLRVSSASPDKTKKRLVTNLSQISDNTNNTNILDSTFSSTPSVSSAPIPTPTLENMAINIEKSFVFKKKKIAHFHSKSPNNFNTLTHDNYRINEQNEIEINIEDLILIEEKFNAIKTILSKKQCNFLNKACFDWWNFYFNCCLNGRIERFFVEHTAKKNVNIVNLYCLVGMMTIYEISFNHVLLTSNKNIITNLLSLLYNIYIDICESLVSKIRQEYLNSFWVEKLKVIIQHNIMENYGINNNINFNDKLSFYSNCISEYIKLLLISLKNPLIIDLFQGINSYTSAQINMIFLTEIIHIGNANGSVPFCQNKKQQHSYISKSPGKNREERLMLRKPSQKNLTLVLDLDETLMCFIVNPKDPNQGFSRLRPYLYDFLNKVAKHYELIVFTAATQDYADPILNAMETNRRFFDMRLYRENCVIMDGDYVKDISKLGRKVESVIIVDNMQQNYKLQKENGILISSFWGEDTKDKALLELGIILISIAEEFNKNPEKNDVRVLLKKYRDEIVKNVSCR